MRNPGWSPTTVMCPLQGEVSSNRNTLPGLSRLAVGRSDGKGTLQDNAEFSCGSRMIETLFQILNAPARVEPSEERARGRKVASDVDWSGRRREVRLAEIDRHVLKVRVSVGRAQRSAKSLLVGGQTCKKTVWRSRDSGNDQAETGHAPHARRFAECQHADGDGSGGANARPHGISGSKGHR